MTIDVRRIAVLAGAILAATVTIAVFVDNESGVPLGVLRSGSANPVRSTRLPPLWEEMASLSVTQQLTGPGSPSRTFERWNVGGTDLGFTFFHQGDLYMVFGDTYGKERGDWRSNTMAKIAAIDSPATGLEIEAFVSDESGRAAELLSSPKVYWVESTVIPTNGISVGSRMILHYMSVRRWLSPGRWQINNAGLAYSDDDGLTWTRVGPLWGHDSSFAQVALVNGRDDPEHIYMFGIPAGRFGGVRLARVSDKTILRIDTYEYWDGNAWSPRAEHAGLMVPAPVGELSVSWNEYLGKWLMMYLDESLDAIVLRTSDRPTGPWSEERLVTTAKDHPQLYAPFIIPFETDEPSIFFTMSRWDSYNVYLMHLKLR